MLPSDRGPLHRRRRGFGRLCCEKTYITMRICRFNDERLGIVEGLNVRDVTAALDVLPAYHYPLPSFDVLIANLDKVTARAKALAGNSPSFPLTSVTLL